MLKRPTTTEEWTEKHYNMVAWWASKIAPKHIREDAKSTAFIAIAQALEEFDGRGTMNLLAYVRQIARNRVIDFLRKEWKQSTIGTEPRTEGGRILNEKTPRACDIAGVGGRHNLPTTPEEDLQIKEAVASRTKENILIEKNFPLKKSGSKAWYRTGIETVYRGSSTFHCDNIPLGIFRTTSIGCGKKKRTRETSVSLAKRRDNVPDPTRDGFPWS